MIAREITARGPAVAALVSPSGSGTFFVAAASVDVDLRPALKAAFARCPGKGGGEPKLVQGSFTGPDALAALVAQLP